MLVQVTENSLRDSQTEDSISVLKPLLELYCVQYGANGMFKGEIRPLSPKAAVENEL